MAGLYRLGVTDPQLGRTLLLITGALLVPVTLRTLARRLIGDWRAASVAAALIAATASSCSAVIYGAATAMAVPFFVGVFLWALVESLERESGAWWLGAGRRRLRAQANLAAAIPLGRAGLWFAWESWRRPGLRQHWWLWMTTAAGIVLVLSAPVLIHNLFFKANTVTQLQEHLSTCPKIDPRCKPMRSASAGSCPKSAGNQGSLTYWAATKP